MLKFLTRCVLAASLVVWASSAYAQGVQTGTISGTVLDATGGVLPGVTITLTSQDRGFSRDTVTDENGRFVFPAVPIGSYTVLATLQGFETFQSTDNLVEVDKMTAVQINMKIGALTDTIQVVGETPIVDPTKVTQTTRLTRDEFDKLPVGRSYQSLIAAAPGVVGGGNTNALGALTSNNQFVIDAVDTTDPTTGTFGTNLNFEAIQEVSVLTNAVGVEYGRAQGAITNIVTKSGTNRFEGAFKYIFLNDNWDAQNTTTSETTGASLERVKYDHVNPTYSYIGGGPIWKDRAFFFGTYEYAPRTSPQQQTAGQIPEDYQQTTESKFANIRGTVQLAEGHTAWVKYYRSPTTGFAIAYHSAGEREALTAQDQTAKNWAAQWSGVIRNNWSMEAAFATYDAVLTVKNFEDSGFLNNSPIFNIAENRWYNGGAFDGFTDRPRKQFNLASNWFVTLGGRSHNVKVGYDFQDVESGLAFDYPSLTIYRVDDYIQATRTIIFGPQTFRRDYDSGASVSTGVNNAIYARDKFELTDRVSVEAGVRVEVQKSAIADLDTVNYATFAPRASATYDLAGDGKTLISGSYGRYHGNILQSLSDAFSTRPARTNYDNYRWDPASNSFVFNNRVQLTGGASFVPNTDVNPQHMDEVTVGFQRQVGRYMAAGIRFVGRRWDDLIDDVIVFNPDRTINRQIVNYDPAKRSYRGVILTAEKRFSDNWNAGMSYTYSHTRGNHFADNFTSLGDFLDSQCRTTADPTVGTIPCSEVQDGANKYGPPGYDRPHNFKLNGAYVRPIGPVNLTVGALTEAISKTRYEKVRSLDVLFPGTTIASGNTATYFYNERGADPVEGIAWFVDASVEATWRIWDTAQAGFKTEIFNLTNREEKLLSNNTTWCGSDSSAACTTARNNYGKAAARNSFRLPRQYRFSLIFRF